MATAAPELPVITDQTAFNLKRWEEVCVDPFLSNVSGRIETNALGQIIMTPPPAPEHGEGQFSLGALLNHHLPTGHVITECPVSTVEGIKLADVAWISRERRESQRGMKAFVQAPEICVEILSPGNTRAEIDLKRQLYFDSGADEVWVCGLDGSLRFFLREAPDVPGTSLWCPAITGRIGA